ncbi:MULTISPECIES: hypothetical protein [unclassified Caballeronia]|uniref:hypothetical protein n=1 Tax=unclassified Caballeronia TaxID=2646786 RepID=UPI00286C3D8D|nr:MULTISPECIES: hypothetical protein [unclassified Caballeronia]
MADGWDEIPFSQSGHHFEIDVRLNEVQRGPQARDNLWPEHRVVVVKETVWQPKRRFHMEGRFGRKFSAFISSATRFKLESSPNATFSAPTISTSK